MCWPQFGFCQITIEYSHLLNGEDAVNYVFLLASPRKGAEIFAVVELDVSSAATHQGVGNRLVFNGEVEFVGLDCCGGAPAAFLEACLNGPALVGFPDISLVNHKIELSGLHALAEDIVELELKECGGKQQKRHHRPSNNFLLNCHFSLWLKEPLKVQKISYYCSSSVQ